MLIVSKKIVSVLLQEYEDGSHGPVGYWSHVLYDKQQKLPTTCYQCLAAVRAVEIFLL